MNNPEFHRLLRQNVDGAGEPFTVGKLAAAVYAARSRVNDALNNVPKRGGLLRPKLARYIRQHFNNWERLLAALGWTEDGQIVPRGESHVEQNPAPRDCETLPGGEARDE